MALILFLFTFCPSIDRRPRANLVIVTPVAQMQWIASTCSASRYASNHTVRTRAFFWRMDCINAPTFVDARVDQAPVPTHECILYGIGPLRRDPHVHQLGISPRACLQKPKNSQTLGRNAQRGITTLPVASRAGRSTSAFRKINHYSLTQSHRNKRPRHHRKRLRHH